MGFSRQFRVELTPNSLDELAAIHRHVARDSPRKADRLIERLVSAAKSLEVAPERGRIALEGIVDGVTLRQITRLGVRMVYSVHDARVVVHHFTHASRLPRHR